jgi:hypothetical protein
LKTTLHSEAALEKNNKNTKCWDSYVCWRKRRQKANPNTPYKKISSPCCKQKPTEQGRRLASYCSSKPFHPLISRPARRRRSPKHALPRGTPSPWTCTGRSSSTIPTVTSPRTHSPPFPAQFRAVFLRLLGFNRVPWSERGFGLVCLCRCGDGVHRGAGGDLPGPSVSGWVPSGEF